MNGTVTVARWWHRFLEALPMRLALAGVAAVWVLGCVWSFTEQRAFAAAKGFEVPELLPLGLDGFAAAMAGVAYAASLDGRPAVGARLGTALAIGLTAASNGLWAAQRSGTDPATIGLAVVVPVIANIAFEVLLGEMRRRVQRRRGLPAPVAVPLPRVIRLVLAPGATFTEWRAHVLDVTSTTKVAARPGPAVSLPWPTVPGHPAWPGTTRDDPGRVGPARDGSAGHGPGLGAEGGDVAARVDQGDATPPGGLVRPTQDGLTDPDIVAVLSRRATVPGIGTIRSEFRVGAGRAARLQKDAERAQVNGAAIL